MQEFNPKPSWNSRGGDNVIEDFYKPALRNNCNLYQRMAGFFTSTSFHYVISEIIEFIERNGRIQLITSPNLSTVDKTIIEKYVHEPENMMSEIFFDDLKKDAENNKLNLAKLMGYMLNHKKLEIKIAIPKDGVGLYHEKIGIMYFDDGKKISFSGSVNETSQAWKINPENFEVFCSWSGDRDNTSIQNHQKWFNNLWNNTVDEIAVYELPQAVKAYLLKIEPASDEEFHKLLDEITKKNDIAFKKPNIELYDYQKEARNAWIENNYQGLFAMATGTGKTYAAFSCINKIQKSQSRTAIIIACPQKHLLEQWHEELLEYNSGMPEDDKVNLSLPVFCDSDYPDWRSKFRTVLTTVNEKPLGHSEFLENHFIVFVTHATLGTVGKDSFNEKIDMIKNLKKFIIIDEVHNVAENSSKNIFRDDYDFRLGLSATPDRHLDPIGTRIIYDYFDSVVYDLPLKDAIKKGFLCKYRYYPTFVSLTSAEMEMYDDLTAQIAIMEVKKKKGTYHQKKGDFDPSLERTYVVQAAANKLPRLKEILNKLHNRLEQTLVYCTSNKSQASPPESLTQLREVQKILSARNIISDAITWKDPTKDRRKILRDLANDHYDCITAVKCLDEGVDVPSVKTGIFLASSGNPKEFIQRRGRVLRKNTKAGKTYAIIYDILVSPPTSKLENAITRKDRKLIAKELLRCKEFASLSDNESDAIESIDQVLTRFNIPYHELTREWISDNL